MTTFRTATDAMLTEQIRTAKDRVIFVAPGLSQAVASELVNHQHCRSITVILDADEEVCRIGYGDATGFEHLTKCGGNISLRKHSGVRLGLLMADRVVTIWSPTPRAVDGERKPDQPNAIVIEGGIAEDSTAGDPVRTETLGSELAQDSKSGGSTIAPGVYSLAEQLAKRLDDERVGEEPIERADLEKVVKDLKENPPAPFDLARKVRVFSTKFQYVEVELQGVEWTERRIKLSGFLLNSDLPDGLREILETQIRPYRTKGDVPINVPCIVRGQIAYNQHGDEIRIPTTQHEMERMWKDIRERYLFRIPGFGTLVRKRELAFFRAEVEAYERVLIDWATQFRQEVKRDEKGLVSDIVKSIEARIKQSGREQEFRDIDLDTKVRSGLEGMRVFEPRVRMVIKDVSWESSRDQEFTAALRSALPPEDLQGWFDEFVAVQQRR